MKLSYVFKNIIKRLVTSDLLIVRSFDSGSVSIGAQGAASVYIPITVPSGYQYVTFLCSASQGMVVPSYPLNMNSSNQVQVWYKNPSSATVSGWFTVFVLFMKKVGGVVRNLIAASGRRCVA